LDSWGFRLVWSSISEVFELLTSLRLIPGRGKMPGGQSMYPEKSIKGTEFVSLAMLNPPCPALVVGAVDNVVVLA
jgi:hypothetical protein